MHKGKQIKKLVISLLVAFLLVTNNMVARADSSAESAEQVNAYYVAPDGSDSNPGTITRPWKTLRKAVRTLPTGSTLYIRGGEYDAAGERYAADDINFLNSGTAANPITLTNYPGEQAIIRLNGKNAFSCYWREEKTTVAKTDYIHIIGTDVAPRTLPNGVVSQKGIVIMGVTNEMQIAIHPFGCDYWEIAGIDFIDVRTAIFAMKHTEGMMVDNSTDHWYIHDNRVYRFWGDQGMQFNGNYNLIENNEIYKVTDVINRPFGCGMVNFMGNNNTLRGNKLSRLGSNADCAGFGFEWNLADANLIEDNYIWDVTNGFGIHGGDGNIIRDNTIIAAPGWNYPGAYVESHDNRLDWPCDDRPGTGSPSNATLPPDNPAHFDYPYYYPWECHSRNNQIVNNVFVGFWRMIGEVSVSDPSNIYSGNVTSTNTDPTPISPIGSVGTDRPNFKWKTVGLASSYKLAVFSDAESAYVIQSVVSNTSCTATECTYPSPVSVSNGNYRFKVLAYTSGGTTPYSDWLSFTVTGVVVSPPAEPPVLTGPNGAANPHRPTFQWNAVPNATFYRLAVYSNETSVYMVVENVYPSCAAGICSYTPSTWDLPNGSYKFKMRSRNSAGYTDFGEMASFSVSSDLPVAPTLLAPLGTVTENPPAFQWGAVSGATEYRLMVYSKVSGNYVLDTDVAPGACSGSVCTYVMPAGLASGGYKFKMLTYNEYGMSGFSAFMSFSVP